MSEDFWEETYFCALLRSVGKGKRKGGKWKGKAKGNEMERERDQLKGREKK